MDQYIGQIILFGGNFAPRNWALCNGQLLPISSNQSLFSVIGTTYGGDGRATFALPDLKGRVPIHAGNGAGLPPIKLGEKGGLSANILTIEQLPSHGHTATVQATTPVGRGEGTTNPTNAYPAEGSNYATVKNVAMAGDSVAIGQTGSNQAINNMQPFTAINYIIALEGIFPPRN